MIGTKHISDLITDPDVLKKGRINIIDAGVSAGKTRFALTTIPKWTGNHPERILYLIDTKNGEFCIQQEAITIDRMDYAFYEYNTNRTWGENAAKGRMPIMTYSGLGAELRKNTGAFHWLDFDYVICDEMQNLVRYQNFPNAENLVATEVALRTLAIEKKAIVVAISATPQNIREHFGELCYNVPFDRSDLCRLETFSEIPYSCAEKDLLKANVGKTGILYTPHIWRMKLCIDYANSIGMRANGFWSPSDSRQKEDAHSKEQWDLRDHVLWKKTIPDDLDLLVINMSSETCIKIDGKKRKVDFMIIHDKDEEIRTQVRGRYHGDLEVLYYHDLDETNQKVLQEFPVIDAFLERRLYSEDQKALCNYINYRKPNGTLYAMPTVIELLRENGYDVSESKQDSSKGGKRYRVITKKMYQS